MPSNQQEQEYESQYKQDGVKSKQSEEMFQSSLVAGGSKMDVVDLGLALVVASVADVINIVIPFAGLVGIGLLWIWLWFKGVDGIGGWGIGTSLVGAIPVLGNILPETITFVIAAYIIAKSPVKLPTKISK